MRFVPIRSDLIGKKVNVTTSIQSDSSKRNHTRLTPRPDVTNVFRDGISANRNPSESPSTRAQFRAAVLWSFCWVFFSFLFFLILIFCPFLFLPFRFYLLRVLFIKSSIYYILNWFLKKIDCCCKKRTCRHFKVISSFFKKRHPCFL